MMYCKQYGKNLDVKVKAQKVSQQRKTTILNQDHSQNIIPNRYLSNTKHTCHPLHHDIQSTAGHTTCSPWAKYDLPNLEMRPMGQVRSS